MAWNSDKSKHAIKFLTSLSKYIILKIERITFTLKFKYLNLLQVCIILDILFLLFTHILYNFEQILEISWDFFSIENAKINITDEYKPASALWKGLLRYEM